MQRAGHGLRASLAVALLTAAQPSFAQPQAPASETAPAPRSLAEPVDAAIDIERAPGAEACPDADAVFSALRRLFPERAFHQSAQPSGSGTSAHVAIRPLSPGYEAALSVLGPRRGERVILEKDADCRGLADALALAFMLLVEPPDAKGAPETSGAAATPQPAPGSTAPATTPPSNSAHSDSAAAPRARPADAGAPRLERTPFTPTSAPRLSADSAC